MALITTIEELRAYLPVAYSNGTSQLPAFEEVESSRIVPIIGATLYTALQQHYDAETLTANENLLIRKCRFAIAAFAYLGQLPYIQVRITDGGLMAFTSENTRPAYKWEYEKIEEDLRSRGNQALENLISFLQGNSETYSEWQNSAYNDPLSFGIIRNGTDLASVFLLQLQQPQRVYGLIKPIFNTIQERFMVPTLGEDFYLGLNSRILTNQLSTEDSQLLKKLRPACAHYAMKLAANQMSVRISEAGFTVSDGSRIKDSWNEGQTAANEAQIGRFIREMDEAGSYYLSQAVKYLNQTATSEIFPEWYESAFYKDPNAEAAPSGNSSRTGVFVAGR